jgi:hypothetical protein
MARSYRNSAPDRSPLVYKSRPRPPTHRSFRIAKPLVLFENCKALPHSFFGCRIPAHEAMDNRHPGKSCAEDINIFGEESLDPPITASKWSERAVYWSLPPNICSCSQQLAKKQSTNLANGVGSPESTPRFPSLSLPKTSEAHESKAMKVLEPPPPQEHALSPQASARQVHGGQQLSLLNSTPGKRISMMSRAAQGRAMKEQTTHLCRQD